MTSELRPRRKRRKGASRPSSLPVPEPATASAIPESAAEEADPGSAERVAADLAAKEVLQAVSVQKEMPVVLAARTLSDYLIALTKILEMPPRPNLLPSHEPTTSDSASPESSVLSLKDSRESNVSSLNDSNASSPASSLASSPASEPNVSNMEDSSESIPNLNDSSEPNVSNMEDSSESIPNLNDSSEPNVSNMEDSSESIPALSQAHSRVICPDEPVQFVCPLEQEPVPQTPASSPVLSPMSSPPVVPIKTAVKSPCVSPVVAQPRTVFPKTVPRVSSSKPAHNPSVMILPSRPRSSLVLRQDHDRLMFLCVSTWPFVWAVCLRCPVTPPRPLVISSCNYYVIAFTCVPD
ncbi:uncharacterized protein LOC143714009 [Siphateles boraxobius]|uniref:uncharacterized protein LOC143714009 n=1 Tax=Siphateles boraxobius TaxID=180520 RepID=UPI00406406E7